MKSSAYIKKPSNARFGKGYMTYNSLHAIYTYGARHLIASIMLWGGNERSMPLDCINVLSLGLSSVIPQMWSVLESRPLLLVEAPVLSLLFNTPVVQPIHDRLQIKSSNLFSCDWRCISSLMSNFNPLRNELIPYVSVLLIGRRWEDLRKVAY